MTRLWVAWNAAFLALDVYWAVTYPDFRAYYIVVATIMAVFLVLSLIKLADERRQ